MFPPGENYIFSILLRSKGETPGKRIRFVSQNFPVKEKGTGGRMDKGMGRLICIFCTGDSSQTRDAAYGGGIRYGLL